MSESPQANAATTPDAAAQVRIRMYRLSVGDCLLLTFPREDGSSFRMMIDCGIHQSKSGGSKKIRKVVKNILAETGGKLDLLVITHEHADHVSGFRLAKDDFRNHLKVKSTWYGWTEDDDDPLARELAGRKYKAIRALARANVRMRMMGLEGASNPLEALLGFIDLEDLPSENQLSFYRGGGGSHSSQAGETINEISETISFKEPGEQPFELPGIEGRIFVLGPPRSKELIKKDAPTSGSSEVYHFGAYVDALAAIEPALGATAQEPFDDAVSVPLDASKALTFFQDHYWLDRVPGSLRDASVATTQNWRRVDQEWLQAATTLALKLDEDTNNTSLVLAIELGPKEENGPVLLFAADAQVGNWLSWQNVVWDDYHGRRITGPDLLRRTIVYKVGHHGSHNATLRELGLELMEALELALLPTDRKMAEKVHWGRFPLPSLVKRLEEKTRNKVIRTDQAVPQDTGRFTLKEDKLFYEITF